MGPVIPKIRVFPPRQMALRPWTSHPSPVLSTPEQEGVSSCQVQLQMAPSTEPKELWLCINVRVHDGTGQDPHVTCWIPLFYSQGTEDLSGYGVYMTVVSSHKQTKKSKT